MLEKGLWSAWSDPPNKQNPSHNPVLSHNIRVTGCILSLCTHCFRHIGRWFPRGPCRSLIVSFSSLDKTNKESVRAIQKSIFTVCLDAPMPQMSEQRYQSRVAAQMLHGGGSRWNSGNRWFDKTLQVSSWDWSCRTKVASSLIYVYIFIQRVSCIILLYS